MAKSKQCRLVERLLDLTNKGEIHWDQVAGDDTFVTALGQGGAVITKDDGLTSLVGREFPGLTLATLRLTDSAGETIDEIRAANFVESPELEMQDMSKLLEELFNSARRKAKRADQFIDKMLEELDKREKVG